MDFDEFKYPENGDQLFKKGSVSEYNLLVSLFSDRAFSYITGYKKAADIIVEQVDNNIEFRDTLFFPIAYLYKHSIELLLKKIVKDGNHILGKETEPLFTHNLITLWGICRPILEEIWPEGDPKELNATEATIQEYSEVDPFDTAFRYHVDKKGNKSLKNISFPICIKNLSEVANKTYNLLDGCIAAIDSITSDMRNIEY